MTTHKRFRIIIFSSIVCTDQPTNRPFLNLSLQLTGVKNTRDNNEHTLAYYNLWNKYHALPRQVNSCRYDFEDLYCPGFLMRRNYDEGLEQHCWFSEATLNIVQNYAIDLQTPKLFLHIKRNASWRMNSTTYLCSDILRVKLVKLLASSRLIVGIIEFGKNTVRDIVTYVVMW